MKRSNMLSTPPSENQQRASQERKTNALNIVDTRKNNFFPGDN